jgi:hypothetical protein
MKRINLWCGGHWRMKYALTDDSATERLAVKQAFAGANGEETNVTHLLCTVHSSRTLMRRLSHAPESRKYLNSAMFYRKTEGGCIEDINLAVNAAPNETTKQYIIDEWLNDRFAWAMFARQHSGIYYKELQQIPSKRGISRLNNNVRKIGNHIAICNNTVLTEIGMDFWE